MKCLVFLLFILCFGLEFSRALPETSHDTASNKWKEGGENVCFDTVSIYKEVNVSYLSQTITTVYWLHCYWPGFCPRERKRVHMIRWRKQWKTIAKKIFRCCSGWSKKADDAQVCLQPICSLGCRNGGTCIAPGSCKCKEGYEGTYCQDMVDYCAKTPKLCQQVCTNLNPMYKCSCRVGWKLLGDKKNCADIDECKAATSPCTCEKKDGVCSVNCQNTEGSYQCNCGKGYHLTSANQCADTDECLIDKICDQGCTNKPGTYECTCWTGYKRDKIKKKCLDIDECKVAKGGCSHRCKNIDGSYVCLCPAGFHLGADRKTCIRT